MGTVTLLLRVALACVFGVSGIAKLLDRNGTRQAVVGFGVPPALVRLVSLGLAPAELVTAALLLPDVTAKAGLAMALALLVAFTTAVLLALRAGRTVECHCFGRIGGADISLRTVARNAVLATLGIAALLTAAGDHPDAPVAIIGGVALAASVIAVEGLAGRAARRRKEHAEEVAFEQGMVGHLHGGAAAPDFSLPTLKGDQISLGSLLAGGHPVLLVFMMPGCGPCKSMRPAVARWAEAYPDRLTVAVVSRYGLAANAAAYDEWRLDVLVDEDAEVTKAFGVVGTPSAVLVGADGRLRGGLASGERLVRRLLAAALSGAEPDLASALEDDGAPAESIDLESVLRPRSTVTRHEAEEGTVLVDEETGAGATLDQIGAVVWSVLDGSSPLREIVTDLAEAFEAPAEVVGADVLSMVRSLGRAGMLEGIAGEATSDEVDTLVQESSTAG